MNELFKAKRVLFVFSDPAGAKSLLAFCDLYQHLFSAVEILSNRYHQFYSEFKIKVKVVEESESVLKQKMTDFQPDILFTATSYPSRFELISLSLSKSFVNLRSITFIDHWTNFLIRFNYNNDTIFPDQIFVIDEIAKKNACAEGIPSDIISVFGNPFHTFLKKWLPKTSRVEVEKLISNQTKYLLFAPEPLSVFNLESKYGFDEFHVLSFIANTIFELENEAGFYPPVLVFKCHPNHNVEDVKNKIRELLVNVQGVRIIILTDMNINLNDLIYYSESVLGIFSNSLVEASILGKRTAQILPFLKDKNLNPLSHLDYLNVLETKEQLIHFIKEEHEQL